MNLVKFIFLFLIILCISNPVSAQPKYEFRGVWIATVTNIDWPSAKGLPVVTQKAEYISMLDSLQKIGINAVIVQIRPSADAFYPSQYEPWSEFLSGEQGLPPSPYYDPLQFMIDEAHKRGMEFHAWLNPYRAVFDIRNSSVSPTHITRIHKDWFITYGTKKYFNPGLPETREFVTRIVKDIVKRYDVDAIHMDDYFYPYRITGKDFPDAATYRKYGNGMSKDDWRRSNCDSIIRMIHHAIMETKPVVQFGISPFGVWRNKSQDPDGSPTQAGQTNYDDLYADILLWLRKGWIDYLAPQLYWEIGHRLCDYNVLLDWWGKHSYGKHVYIGHGVYRTQENPTAAWYNKKELPNEIAMLRNNNAVQGSIYFSAVSILRNPNGWADSLMLNEYNRPALLPPMPWIDTVPPQRPVLMNLTESRSKSDNKFTLRIKTNTVNETEQVKTFAIYLSEDFASLGKAPFRVITANIMGETVTDILPNDIPNTWNACYISVSAIDRENNESPLSNVVQIMRTTNGLAIAK